MKERDVRLERLFDTARLALPQNEAEAMPLYLKRRVLSQWRTGAAEEGTRGMPWVFRSALICAAVVMFASIAWSLGELTGEADNDVAIANYELRVDVMP